MGLFAGMLWYYGFRDSLNRRDFLKHWRADNTVGVLFITLSGVMHCDAVKLSMGGLVSLLGYV